LQEDALSVFNKSSQVSAYVLVGLLPSAKVGCQEGLPNSGCGGICEKYMMKDFRMAIRRVYNSLDLCKSEGYLYKWKNESNVMVVPK